MTREDGEILRVVRGNLVALAEAPSAADYRVLHGLVAAHGAVKVARIHRDAVADAEDRGSTLGSRALAALVDASRVGAVLAADSAARRRSSDLATTAFRQGCMLLLAGVDPDEPRARVRAVARPPMAPVGYDLAEWRDVLAPVAAAPWAPYGDRLLERARAVGPRAVRIIEQCRAISQEAEARRERAAVAGEIRRLVAETGLSQRDFAPHVGTSASRLATYATGRVVPSATMMLRIRHVARAMAVGTGGPVLAGATGAS